MRGVKRTKWPVVLSQCEEKCGGMYRTEDDRSRRFYENLDTWPGNSVTHEQVQCRATVPNAGCATPCPPVQPTLLRRPCSRAPVVGQRSERVLGLANEGDSRGEQRRTYGPRLTTSIKLAASAA